MHIGIVVGEASGDILGVGLMKALKQHFPSCQFSGIGGQRMLAEGFDSLYPQDRLAVMGLLEPLKRLPELLSIRKSLFKHFTSQQVDVVIGIDSPDFNLTLEKNLRLKGIKTVHYVSPSVWAWRQGRVKLIKKAVDLMLTLLPFEADFYRKHNMPVTFVGHPLADQFPIDCDVALARENLAALIPNVKMSADQKIIACLPGSRNGEVKHIGPTLWQAMDMLIQNNSSLTVIIPTINQQRKEQIELQLQQYYQQQSDIPSSVIIVDGYSQEVMAAADCVVMASGTTTLEALLLKKPMVVVYKKDFLSFAIISRMLKAPYFSLPNLLGGKELVPELLQKAATPEAIVDKTQYWLDHPKAVSALQRVFTSIHHDMRQNASQRAADAVVELIQHPAV